MPQSRVPEKLIVTELVKKFSTSYGTWRFTMFTTACHWALSSARWIHSTPHPISL